MDYADWLTETRGWCPEYEEIVPGVNVETYVQQREREAFITVIWDDGSDGGRAIAFLLGEAEWWAWRGRVFEEYADPRWGDDDALAMSQMQAWLDAEAQQAGKVTAAGMGDDWAGYCLLKARRAAGQ